MRGKRAAACLHSPWLACQLGGGHAGTGHAGRRGTCGPAGDMWVEGGGPAEISAGHWCCMWWSTFVQKGDEEMLRGAFSIRQAMPD
jgi:hypothetical protein